MDKTYYTNYTKRDAFYMTVERAATFPTIDGQSGSIGIGIDTVKGVATLFFELGGDWMMFEDALRHNPFWVDDWMPGAIREAVDYSTDQSPSYEDDLEWYLEWADDAEEVIKAKQIKEII